MAGIMDTNNQYFIRQNLYSKQLKSLLLDELIASFVPKQHRALMEDVEARIFAVANSGQTASSLNTINGASHRWVAGGGTPVLAFSDFAKALYALQRANVPLNNLCAVVDPSVAYTIATNTNVVNLLSPIPMWGDVTRD